MGKIGEAIVNSAVYENNTEYRGMADIQLPDVAQMTAEIEGAGIAGKYTSPIIGHIESMKASITFRIVTDETYKLTTPDAHTLEIRVAQQHRNSDKGSIHREPIKYVLIVRPINLKLGKLTPATTGDASGEYAVSYLAGYVGGKKELEVDPTNYIFIMNGKDYLEDIRKALGK